MKSKISNQFLGNFLIIFLLTILATALAFVLMSAAGSLIAGSLAKNRYTAESIIKEDYRQIDASEVVANGGGVQAVDKEYRVVLSEGLDTIGKDSLTAQEFTDFLAESKTKTYHYDILYQPEGEFWLIVTFPTSIRLDFKLIHNKNAPSEDLSRSGLAFGLVLAIYLVIIAAISYAYSRISALRITVPLKKLAAGTRLLREGDYSARVELNLKNEFAELQDTFNGMAERIEKEISLRKKAEEGRKRLILDISHDLKNPLSSIQGYAEILSQKAESPEAKAIHQNSIRANRLLNELFELSQLDSPDYKLRLSKTDICEALRRACGELIAQLEASEFSYEFDIPEEEIFVMLDADRFRRIIQNLADNAVRYNPKGTKIFVSLEVRGGAATIRFADDGVGIPESLAEDIFNPFVRGGEARSPKSGGSGLGLSIAQKIAKAHGGDLILCKNRAKGSVFELTIPTI
ncbi:MAG TPA: HAMP domain-containing sensor histidine kinase [Clostridia bacterium]|jgi:signal transduction histidine kinase|nr:HAMP domain-containing sensor histidine kinase [Clostridia bacterium]HOL60541.1 HAMP domain-containing sensor histidine kinase [Clostridia bacterium]HPO52948.1 HAMP domain-containing sensor histidine kinase [Clostridia bacterium]